MDNELVSIVVPVYGVEAYLAECIDSLLRQTYQNIEIVLVDDGSKDRCPEICDAYAQKDPRVKVVHKANGGLVSARKAGLLAASGQYLMYVDGDDWVSEAMVEKMQSQMMQHQPDCVICNFYDAVGETIVKQTSFFLDGYYNADLYQKTILQNVLFTGKMFVHGINPSLCGKLFHRGMIEQYGMSVPNNITIGEDAACTYPFLLDACQSVVLMDEAYYYYRKNPESMMNRYDANQLDRTREMLAYMQSATKGHPVFYRQFDYYVIMIAILDFVNEQRGPIGSVFRRYKLFRQYLKNCGFFKSLERIDKSLLSRNERIYTGAFSSPFGNWLLFLLTVRNYVRNKRK